MKSLQARLESNLSNAGSGDAPFRMLVDAVADYAIYMLDPDGHVASWNTGAKRAKGYDADEIIGRHFSVFYTEEDRRAGLPAKVLETAERHGKFEAEGWRVRKDGSRFWAHVVLDSIRGTSGELVGFAKITRDLTERRAAERSLRETQEEFALLLQSVTDYAIYMLDAGGRVSTWNPGARRIKDTSRPKSSASISRASTRRRIALPASRHGRWKPPRGTGASRRKAGACGRMARASGRMS